MEIKLPKIERTKREKCVACMSILAEAIERAQKILEKEEAARNLATLHGIKTDVAGVLRYELEELKKNIRELELNGCIDSKMAKKLEETIEKGLKDGYPEAMSYTVFMVKPELGFDVLREICKRVAEED